MFPALRKSALSLSTLLIASGCVRWSDAASRCAPPPQQRDQFAVALLEGNSACIGIKGGSGASAPSPGEKFTLVMPARQNSGEVALFCSATLERRAALCSGLEQAMVCGPYYSLRLEGAAAPPQRFAIAVRTRAYPGTLPGPTGGLRSSEGGPVFLKACTSSEGLHFSAWKGPPSKSQRIWHAYVYLGYDTEPDCAADESAPLEEAETR